MNKEIVEYLIEKINEVINSKSSTLSGTDIEKLVVIREKLKNSKGKKGLLKAIALILPFFTGD